MKRSKMSMFSLKFNMSVVTADDEAKGGAKELWDGPDPEDWGSIEPYKGTVS